MKRTTTSISTQPLNKAVFLDRDGTINSDEGHYYIYKPEDFVFNPGVIEGLKRLQKAGYLLIVITNQGKHGVTLTKIYYCPHHESIKTCVCRKPSPYMVNLAIEEFHIDKKRSWFIGDSSKDVKCAEDAGVKPLRIHKNQDITPVIDQILKSKDSF